MYYVELKESDSIELQEPLTEHGLIEKARNYSTEFVSGIPQAIRVLNNAGYSVFEDC